MWSVSTLPHSRAMASEDQRERIEMSPGDRPIVGPILAADCRRLVVRTVEVTENQRRWW
jgi:hypothetical protein